jgi:uncharacterized protein YndB with AHSA1/START domain
MTEPVRKAFTVAVPPARAWAAFADPVERSRWEAQTYEIDPRPGGRVHWELPGIECSGVVDEVEPERLLRHTEGDGPHRGSVITVTFEAVDAGTRVTITHAGFGDDWDEWVEGTSHGWDQAIADLVFYLETDVPADRFVTMLPSPGMRLREDASGLVVTRVGPEGFAADAGLAPGDRLLRLGGAPVWTIGEVWVVLRLHSPGDDLSVEFVRDGERRRASGRIGTSWDTPPAVVPTG